MGKSPYNGTFSKPLNETSAYWLGLLWADGSIGEYNGSYRVSLGLKSEDKYHVKRLAEHLGYDPSRVRDRGGYSELQINSVDLYTDLSDWGMKQNKGQEIDEIYCETEHMQHFMRGLFDGDGSVGLYEVKSRGYKRPSFSFHGRETAVMFFKDVIEDAAGIELGSVSEDSSGAYRVSTSARDSIPLIFDYLYSEGCLCLCRKKQAFEDIMNYNAPDRKSNRKYEKYTDDGRGLVRRQCDFCGSIFWKRADHASRVDNDYCSRECSGKANYGKANEARWN